MMDETISAEFFRSERYEVSKSCGSRQKLSLLQRVFTCTNRRRYSRERASQSLEVIPTGSRKFGDLDPIHPKIIFKVQNPDV